MEKGVRRVAAGYKRGNDQFGRRLGCGSTLKHRRPAAAAASPRSTTSTLSSSSQSVLSSLLPRKSSLRLNTPADLRLLLLLLVLVASISCWMMASRSQLLSREREEEARLILLEGTLHP